MEPEARRVFRTAVEEMTASWLWELFNQAQHRIPDPVDYIEMRRYTFGTYMTNQLARLRHGKKVPDEVYRSGPVQALEKSASDYAALVNDVFSYQKEIEYEGELHNCVLVVQNFFGCDYPTALNIVHDLMTSRMKQFQHIAENELPVLYEDFRLPGEARAVLDGYVRELQNWMAGILIWHRDCRRYGADDLRHQVMAPGLLGGISSLPGPPGLPSGVGMSAARVPALRLSS
jgi:germacradienol/geosmin synthase